MKVVPALLNKSTDEFSDQLTRLKKYHSHFQIDIADGIFVPNITIQINDLTSIFQSPPAIESLTFDFHLMVKDYEKEVKKLEKLAPTIKIKTILIHAGVFPNYKILTATYPQFSFGIVLNPEDPVETIKTNNYFKFINDVQIMTVNPGFQGSPFIPEAVNKVEQIRAINYETKIYIDGAVNKETIPLILSHKETPDFLCIGSYLTKALNLEENEKYLSKIPQYHPN